jgi:RNA polymerase sigma factor (sigma-70 family)
LLQVLGVSDFAARRSGPPPGEPDRGGRTGEFETLYRDSVGAVTAYFARRTSDPQIAADLTADTFVAAIRSFGTFDPRRGSARAWIFGVARHCFARHCAVHDREQEGIRRLARRRRLDADETAELVARIDAEAPGRALLAELAAMSATDREAVELVDLAGLEPREAARALGVSPGAMRLRLFRARTKLRATLEPGRDDHVR